MDTATYSNLKILDDDDGTTVAERGMVDTNGESAVIRDWNFETGKYSEVDRLTEAKIKRTSKGVSMLTGVSQGLVRMVGVPKENAVRTLKLQHGKGLPLTPPQDEA